jgi:NAD(P)-dependent dehydrogenase (short-subunit alcohol dehydrogenase family)/acyl carrier protein
MDVRQREDYGILIKDLKASGLIPNRIVHWWCASAEPATMRDADPGHDDGTGFFSLMYLAQALADQLDTAAIQIRAVTRGAQMVIGDERIFPERAMIQGACRVIAQELPQLAAQAIDITHDAAADPREQNLIGQLLSEFSSIPQDPVVALRRGERWVRTYTKIRLEAPGVPQLLRPGGVYLITGGLSGIGLVIAAYLARAVQAKLVLIGRAGLPPRDQWPAYVSKQDAQDPIRSKIETIRELERLGAQVLTASADVTQHGQITELKHRIADHFGNVHGIVHSAGIAGGGIIPLKTKDTAARVMNPKVIGTRVLEAVFAQEPLDFIVLCSSLSAMLGGYGQIDYCAANCFLDAFAQQNRFQQHGAQTVAINWDTWSEVGMAVNTEVPEDLKHWQREGLRRGIRSLEGVAVFERVLSSRQKQMAISTTDLHLRIQQATEMMNRHAPAAPAPVKASASHSRPQLSVAYVAPGNRTEESLAALWSEMLGIESVGVNDNFLELGGHSLLATQMISRIRDTFQVEISVKTFFEAPTVAEIAQLIAGKTTAADEPEAQIAQGPSLVPLPRDQYRTVISDEGDIEIPEVVKQQLSDEP